MRRCWPALSGWLYAHFQRAANPTPFGAQAGIEYLFIAVVGGAGYVWGAVLGAGIVVILKEILQSYLPYIFGGQSQLETIVFGILLVVLLQLAPTGVWPWLMSRLPLKPARKMPDTSLDPAARAVRAPSTPSVLLHIEKARKQFGGVIAVNDVSFDVRAARDRGADRPQRRRQEHDLQPDHGRADLDRRRRSRCSATRSTTRRRRRSSSSASPVPSSMSSWCPT